MARDLPNMFDHLDQASIVLGLSRVGLIVDFDGTISEIAPTPAEATLSSRAAVSLASLSKRLDLVSVMSGRKVDELIDKVHLDGIVYVGNHGAEYVQDGELTVAPGASEYQDVLDGVYNHIKASVDIEGIVWDYKRFSVAIHIRPTEDPEAAKLALGDALESAPGVEQLQTFWGKMLLEIRSPLVLNKGYAVRQLVDERALDGEIFIGDDITDVDAMKAVTELRNEGQVQGFSVAAIHHDSPDAVHEAADYGVDGVTGVEELLEWLDEAASG